jgi:hypothetical protein
VTRPHCENRVVNGIGLLITAFHDIGDVDREGLVERVTGASVTRTTIS